MKTLGERFAALLDLNAFVSKELVESMSALPCSECGHPLGRHVEDDECDYDRGDRQVQEVGAVAMGPCGCKGGVDFPEEKRCIEALRAVKADL